MALIYCPECGREISSSAEVCPGCAYPVKTGTPPIPPRAVAKPVKMSTKQKRCVVATVDFLCV